jgi:group I intron endonuclease
VACSDRCSTYLTKLGVKPLAIWENLDEEGIKNKIYPMIKPLAGIYMILNLVTGDFYIGSAITGKMPNRFHKHLFGFSGNKIVAAAVQKYGLSNFAFIVLEILPNVVSKEENKDLLSLEDKYLNTLKPIYNIAPIAGNTLGVKHSDATKAKMKLNYSSERREALAALNKGKTFSESTIKLMRLKALARGPHSVAEPETLAKISVNSTTANLYSITLLGDDNTPFPNYGSGKEVRTINKVAELLGCNEKTIRRALKTNGIVKGK